MSEKKLITLTIDPEFRDLIPPLTEEEQKMLEDSIVRYGCEQPLVVWNGVLVDGHNRYGICQKHSIPFAIEEKDFEDRNDVTMWMLRNQLGRRNLTDYNRGEMVLKLKAQVAEEAAKRKRAGGSLVDQHTTNLSDASCKGETFAHLGRIAGVSGTQMKKIDKLASGADEETKQKLRSGKVSIHKAYTELMEKEHAAERKICERCGKEKSVSEFGIPSNSRGFSALCKECVKEIDEASKTAARVAAATTDPVETVPVGRDVNEGCRDITKRQPTAYYFVPGTLEDKPEHYPFVRESISRIVSGFIDDVDRNIRMYGQTMITKEHTDELISLLKSSEQVMEVLYEHLENMGVHPKN